MNTPRTNAIQHYLHNRRSFEKTDNQVWREHAESMEIQLNMAQKLLNAYETQLATVMPPEFKNEDAAQRPILVKLTIEGLRQRVQMFETHFKEQRRILESRNRDTKITP